MKSIYMYIDICINIYTFLPVVNDVFANYSIKDPLTIKVIVIFFGKKVIFTIDFLNLMQ